MAAKKDSKIGLHAVIPASRDEVVQACTRAVEVLGGSAEASVTSAKVTVKIRPGLFKKVSSVSPVVGINLAPGDEGRIVLNAKIETFRTIQSRYMFIPVGPKRLVGKSTYFNLLTSLEQELAALGRGNASIRRTGVTN